MSNTSKARRSLEEILASTSDVLFPAELGKAPVTIHSVDCDGDTPLHVMVWRDDVAAVRTLVESGVNVNAVGDMGETPLHVAVGKESIGTIEALLSAGARSDVRSEFDETAFERAMKKGGKIAALFRQARGA